MDELEKKSKRFLQLCPGLQATSSDLYTVIYRQDDIQVTSFPTTSYILQIDELGVLAGHVRGTVLLSTGQRPGFSLPGTRPELAYSVTEIDSDL